MSTSTRLIRFNIPTNMINLAVSTPAGYTCFIESAGVVDCQTTATTNIAAGAHVDIVLFGTVPRDPGPLSVTATADPLNAVPEGDETDNSATSTVTVQPPDFSITLTPSPAEVEPGGATTLTAVVTNDGPANARLTTSEILLRLTLPSGLTNVSIAAPAGYTCASPVTEILECNATATQNLAAGGSLTFTVNSDAPTAGGTSTATASADPLDVIPEADETDNAATATITVNG